jgi:hypothetical protein
MASPINVFKSVVADLTTTQSTIYTTPASITTVVLLAQVSNVSGSSANVTFLTSSNNTELVKDFTIPVGDAAALIDGKLILESGESILAYASGNSQLKITLSILESA